MPKPPPSSGRGRPARSGKGRAARGAPRSPGAPPRQSEGPPWKARAADDERARQAGWGGVARKGAGRVRDAGPGDASKAFRDARPGGGKAWEPEVWIDEGIVQGEARRAVVRGRAARPRRSSGHVDDGAPEPALGRVERRLKEASRDFRRERFEDVRRALKPLAESTPAAAPVRELLGLTYYRLGRWKLAVAELEALRTLNGSTEQHPVLADCYRALGQHAKVAVLWEELRSASPSAALVAEGRIVHAGSLADQGRLEDAIGVLSTSKRPAKRPKEHHLRVTYALADLHERAGDLPKARQLFGIVAAVDSELGDVEARLRALR